MCKSEHGVWWILLVIVLVAGLGGCSSSSDPDHIASDEEIVALCDRWIEEIESGSSADQLAGLEEIAQFVAEYDYAAAPAPAPDGPPPPDVVPYTLEPTDPPDLYGMFGVIALGNGNRSAALWASLQGLRLVPADAGLLSQAGVIFIDQEDCDEADTLLRKAKSIDGQNALVRLNLSTAHSCRGRVSQAIAEAEAAVELEPGNRLIQLSLNNLYVQEMPAVAELQAALGADCASDIADAVLLNSTAALDAFVVTKNDETQTLAMDMMTLYQTMPLDLPEGLIDALDESDSAYLERYEASCSGPLDEDMQAVQTMISDASVSMAQTLSDCCAATNYACSCFYDYCTSNWDLLETGVDPESYEALDRYLPGAIGMFKGYELALVGDLVEYRPQMSEASADWSARYAYGLLGMHCKEMSLEVAYALSPLLRNRQVAQANCEWEEVCRTAEEEARKAEEERRAEAARLAAAEEAARKAAAAEKAKDDKIKGELCLDSVGCLGIDGSKLSVKVGGGLFAKLTVDTDNLSVGVRVGVGISDPTGGNLAGADISVGGEIGPSGTSVDVVYSQSMACGTVTQEVTLAKGTF